MTAKEHSSDSAKSTKGRDRRGTGREHLSTRESQSALKQRARQLARPLKAPVPMLQPFDLLIFELGKERYGIDMAHVVEVLPLGGMTPVPCTPAFLLGVTNYRGRVLPLVDLGVLLEVGEKAFEFGDRAVVVQVDDMLFGFGVDDVPEVVQMDASGWVPITPTAGDRQPGFVRALTGQMTGVLDLEALCRSGRILVNEGS